MNKGDFIVTEEFDAKQRLSLVILGRAAGFVEPSIYDLYDAESYLMFMTSIMTTIDHVGAGHYLYIAYRKVSYREAVQELTSYIKNHENNEIPLPKEGEV